MTGPHKIAECFASQQKTMAVATLKYFIKCKILFIIFLLKKFMANFFLEIFLRYSKFVTLSTLRMLDHAHQ